MDYVDLYIIHRWDYDHPIEETMEVLNELVKIKVKKLDILDVQLYSDINY